MEKILHQLIGRLAHYLQGFTHPRWCRISYINRSTRKSAILMVNTQERWGFSMAMLVYRRVSLSNLSD